MKSPSSAGWRPQFTLDLRKASPAAFFHLSEDFSQWATEKPAPVIELKDGWLTITPQIAEQMLMLNAPGANRKASISTIAYYAATMAENDWQPTGQPLIFGIVAGRLVLLDGQHRLWACYLSGISFETYIVVLKQEIPGIFAYIDNAKARNLKDALYTAGLDGLSGVSSLVVMMSWYYENDAFTADKEKRKLAKLAPKRGLDYFNAHPNLLQGVRLVSGEHAAVAGVIGYKDVAAFTAAKILDLHDEAVLDEFMDLVGSDLSENDDPDVSAIRALQELIEQDSIKKEQLKKHQILGHVILAFNAWYQRQPVKKLKLAVAENFPKFIGASANAMAAE